MQDHETEESLRVQLDLLALSSPRVNDEIANLVSFDFPFGSISNPSLHEILVVGATEQSNFLATTTAHEPTPTHCALDFLHQPRVQCKSSESRKRDQNNAYFFMSSKEMTTPEYSDARHEHTIGHIRRRSMIPPWGEKLNASYHISNQIIVGTAEATAIFVQGRSGKL